MPNAGKAPPGLTLLTLPSVLVVGAQKGGTSTLSKLMSEHHQIERPKAKELLFFNGNNDFNIKCDPPPSAGAVAGYLANFPPTRGSKVTGEWSATYLQCWCCAPVAASVLPGARVIAILRDPIERAHSRFKEQVYFAKKQKNADGSVNGQPVYLGWDGFVAKPAKMPASICLISRPRWMARLISSDSANGSSAGELERDPSLGRVLSLG